MIDVGVAAELRHDLLTVFNHVIGYCELLTDEGAELGPLDTVRLPLLAVAQAGHDAITALKRTLHPDAVARGEVDRPTLVAALEGPIATIERRTEELLRTLGGDGPEDVVADLKRIRSATARARTLTGGVRAPAVAPTPTPTPATGGRLPGPGSMPPPGPAPASATAPAQGRAAPGGVILVVDDDQDTREVLGRRLQRLGYSTVFAGNGREALDVLAREPVDLVLLDVQMPVLDGFAVLEQRRRDTRYWDIPFVVISSLDDVGSIVRCIDMGAEDYLPKPFDPVLLNARVQACLERKRLRDQERTLIRQLAEWNDALEARVQVQVDELARLSRMRRFLSPQLADAVMSSGSESILQSHRRQVAIVFCDLRGFTPFAEVTEPEDVMAVLREFHDAMGRLIHEFEATVGSFTGDGFMAFFNDPVPCLDPARRAVCMALAMRNHMNGMSDEWARRGHDLGFGVGVSFGYATLGEIGFDGRFDYGVIGSVVNLAARLCEHAARGEILISQRARREVEDVVVLEDRGMLTLAGFHEPAPASAVVGLRDGGSGG